MTLLKGKGFLCQGKMLNFKTKNTYITKEKANRQINSNNNRKYSYEWHSSNTGKCSELYVKIISKILPLSWFIINNIHLAWIHKLLIFSDEHSLYIQARSKGE